MLTYLTTRALFLIQILSQSSLKLNLHKYRQLKLWLFFVLSWHYPKKKQSFRVRYYMFYCILFIITSWPLGIFFRIIIFGFTSDLDDRYLSSIYPTLYSHLFSPHFLKTVYYFNLFFRKKRNYHFFMWIYESLVVIVSGWV